MNAPNATFDLFEDCPTPRPVSPAPRQRAAKASAQPQATPAAAADSANSADSLADAAPVVPAPAPASDVSADDWESVACKLEAQGDYRVLRRLKPCLQWPGDVPEKRLRLVVLDTETTGLDSSKERIIELALLRVDVDCATGLPIGPVRVYDGLEDPGKPIPPEVVALTGIRDADVRGQRLDEDQILALLEGVDLVVAHNAGFDRPFVEARLGRFAELAWACSFADIDWKALGRSSAKLENLAQANGWFYDAHRAEMDCHALLAVLARNLPEASASGLAHLAAAAGQPSYALQATQAPFEAKDKLKSRGYRWNAEQRVWHTRIKDDALLQAECAWLKEQVYGQRRAVVQVEKLDALVRFSGRPGIVSHLPL